ncbi:MAG: RibD family protein, partial [Geminicoccaceae bacterium]|nr:RibD family protein [Geminicoccaceae bacterium]
TLKLAASLDGRIATRTGMSRWITGDRARMEGHRLRANHDAILIGSGTALADDPLLSCRLDGLERRSPVRVVLDRRLRLPAHSMLARTAAEVPLIVITGATAGEAAVGRLTATGAEVVGLAEPSPANTLGELARRGITRVLVEGGASLAASLLNERLVDRLAWFGAPLLIGAEGRPAVAGLEVDDLALAPRLDETGARVLAPDRMQSYIVRSSSAAKPCSPES